MFSMPYLIQVAIALSARCASSAAMAMPSTKRFKRPKPDVIFINALVGDLRYHAKFMRNSNAGRLSPRGRTGSLRHKLSQVKPKLSQPSLAKSSQAGPAQPSTAQLSPGSPQAQQSFMRNSNVGRLSPPSRTGSAEAHAQPA